MGQTANDRLRNYLAELPPQSQALLMREFERAIERGEDTAVATYVLEELRKIVRGADEGARPRTDDPARLVFRPLERFLVDGNFARRPGQIRRASLASIWQWLVREGVPEQAQAFEAALSGGRTNVTSSSTEAAVRTFQQAAGDAIVAIVPSGSGGDRRALARVGGPDVIEDLLPVGLLLRAREAIDTLNGRLPTHYRQFADSQIAAATGALNLPVLQTPQLLPFALSMVMQRLTAPWQIIRIAIKMAASDDEIRVAATPYGVAVTIALHDLSYLTTVLRADIRRSHFENVAENLKTLHDGVRGLRTELDLRSESTWGRQLTAIRAEISEALQSEIESVSGRVRRILRQRPDKDISIGSRVDATEVNEAVALIDFVAVCRTYASELAINEVTLRTYSELQQYVEQATEALVQSLRAGDLKTRAYRQMQVDAAIRFCEVLFGHDYALLMSRAAENAVAGVSERKSSRAG
jgi:peptidoglycan hydrolase-like protein with peptidoglycan-binding domain